MREERHLVRVVPVRGCHHLVLSFASNSGAPKRPRVPACGSENNCSAGGGPSETGVFDELAPSGEMPLDTGEVSATITHQHLKRMYAPQQTAGAAFAKGKLERLVSIRTGCR